MIVGWRDDAERTRVTGLRGARRILQRAALARDAVEAAVAELENGHAIVLVDGAEVARGSTELERPARAA